MKAFYLLPLVLLAIACQAQTDPEGRLVSTHGYGEVKVAPDQAIVSLTARATHRTGKAAKQDVDDRVNRFLDNLKKLSIPQSDVVASQLRIQPRYEYRSNSNRFVGYEASRHVQVTLKKLDDLTEVMDAGLNAGVGNIDSVSYESSEEEKYRLQAHRQAIEDSKAKAAALAKAYNAELGPILRIEYHDNAVHFGAIQADAIAEVASFSARGAQPGVYLPDKITFTDRIQVIFDLIVNE